MKNTIYMENLTDRIAVIFGGTSGMIIANVGLINDILVKLVCTAIFAAIGAIIAFYVKRGLEKKYKQKND